MVGFASFVMIFLLTRVFISLINLLSGNYLKPGKPETRPLLSILIPARNEEKTLPLLLEDLKNATYPNMEIIVCDDHSTDKTPELLKQTTDSMPTLRWFKGEPLASGWLGKNYACYQLAKQAKGDYLMFLDADVRISPDMPNKAVKYMVQKRAALVSLFPTQLMKTLGEQVTVPVMNWVLLSLLPLPLVRLLQYPALAAANGQCMLFDAGNYRKHQWHERVKNDATEDIKISRHIKKTGRTVVTLTGNNDVYCRMYNSSGEAIRGFSRNVHQYFGGSRAIMVIYTLTVLLGWIPVWLYWGGKGIIAYLLLVFANRVAVALQSRQNGRTVLLHPVQMLNFAKIVVKNIHQHFKGSAEWKGREIAI